MKKKSKPKAIMSKEEIAALKKATNFGQPAGTCGEVNDESPAGILLKLHGHKKDLYDGYPEEPYHDTIKRISEWLGLDYTGYTSLTGKARRAVVMKKLGIKINPRDDVFAEIETFLDGEWGVTLSKGQRPILSKADIKVLTVFRDILKDNC